MKLKKFSAFLIIVSVIATSFLPVFSKRANALALPGVPTVVIDPAHIAETVAQLGIMLADVAARAIAQQIINSVVNSTISWAQSGFRGGPAYAVDPKQYFTDIADGVAGSFIAGSDLSFLCSPFQAQIRIALQHQYVQPTQFQCTLTQVVGNIENFYGDFSQGGWDGWFSLTQNSANNPYGAFLDAQVELDNRIAEAIGVEQQQLDWGDGFLSFRDCLETNPPAGSPGHVPGVAVGDCIKEGPTKTPGSVIAEQLNRSIGAPLERVINAQGLENLVNAFVTGVLNRYVFGPAGLF